MAARPPRVRLKTASEMAVEQMPGKLCLEGGWEEEEEGGQGRKESLMDERVNVSGM